MENRINVAELLKGCPEGMELNCSMFDNLFLCNVNEDDLYPITCYTICDDIRNTVVFTEFGEFNKFISSKCVIFPKGKTTWEGFHRQFKDGDIVFYNDAIAIFKEWGDETLLRTYVTKYLCCDSIIDVNVPLFGKSVRKEIRFATEEEKGKLFQAIKECDCKWNEETKTLEKLVNPKFKVGDRVKPTYNTNQYVIKGITATHYTLEEVKEKFKYTEPIINDKDWELVPNNFDINSLVPFESKILVRNTEKEIWKPAIFGVCPKDKPFPFYALGGCSWRYCIPYKDNEHLCGITDDCEDRYKLWLS